jgi:tRNA uridine 5-carboxymethylaminomethyl modification enzyme
LHTSHAEYRLLLRPDSADLRLSDYAYRFGLLDETRYAGVVRKREHIQQALSGLDKVFFTSSRVTETRAQELGIAPLGQMLTARELLRRQGVSYQQVAHLSLQATVANASADGIIAEHDEEAGAGPDLVLPVLSGEVAEEVELQVKYENYVRKQEQLVHRTRRLEEHRIPEWLDYAAIPHLRTQARQKLIHVRPRTIGQASRVEGVSASDLALLMVYLEKMRSTARERV